MSDGDLGAIRIEQHDCFCDLCGRGASPGEVKLGVAEAIPVYDVWGGTDAHLDAVGMFCPPCLRRLRAAIDAVLPGGIE